jgi:A118 family predicted phage portal protein
MSLPTGGTPWPPHPQGIALAQQSLWNAWLVGDPDGLITAYSAADGSGTTAEASFDPKPGVVNRVARFFWSRPSASGQRKERLHVPMAADIATASADLLFSEPPQFLLADDGNEAGEQRVDELLNHGDFHAELVEAAELTAGLGGGWLRLVWDKDIAERVIVDAVAADAAIGEWQWNLLRAVTFFTEYRRKESDQEVIRHLERHEPGRVLHGLYVGSAKELGHPVPLADHPDTAPYAELVDEEGAIATGVAGLTAAYVANMRPQRRWRKLESLAQLGRSDYDGVEPLMDALDECYTSWMRDVRLGKARILVPEFMLKDLGKGQGAAFDQDQEVFTQLNVAPTSEAGKSITPQQFAIRVDEHQQTADSLIDQILDAAGYSPSTFGRQGESAVTATEVVSKERKSDRTRSKKMRYWGQALEPLLTTWLELDALVFGGGARGTVQVAWPDDSQPDPESLSRTIETLNRAVAVSTDTKVRMLHNDWDEEQIAKEVAAVVAESGALVPDVGPLPEYEDEEPVTA